MGGITVDPEVMGGKPVVVGTRITVEEILRRLAAGESPEAILEAFPRLTPEGCAPPWRTRLRSLGRRGSAVFPR